MADGYVVLDGVDDYIETADWAGFPTGDFELRIELEANFDEEFAVVNKYGASGTRSLRVRWTDIAGTPDFQLLVYADGSTVDFQQHSDEVSLSGTQRIQFRLTLDADDGSSGRVITFYQRNPGTDLNVDTGWTQISTHNPAGTTSIYDGTASFDIGQLVTGAETYMDGKVYEMLLWSDLSKTTLVADPNFRNTNQGDWTNPPVTDGAGRSWTLNNGASWTAGSVDPPAAFGFGVGSRSAVSTATPFSVTSVAGFTYGVSTIVSVDNVVTIAPDAGFVLGVAARSGITITGNPISVTPPPGIATAGGWFTNAVSSVGSRVIIAPPGVAVAAVGPSLTGVVGAPTTPPMATVIEVIQSDDLEVGFTLELLDADLVLVEDITADFQSGTVSHGNFRTIHSTLNGILGRPLTWEAARLRPSISLTDRLTGTTYTWQLGVYLPETVERHSTEEPDVYTVEGFDLTYLLDTPYGSGFAVSTTDEYLAVVADLLDAAGVPSYQIDQTKAGVLLASAKSWEAADENTYLRIINDLLAEINYRPVWMDRDGTLRCETYVAPSASGDIFSYDAALATTIIDQGASDELDLWRVPNRFVFINDQPGVLESGEPKLPVEGDGVYTVVNQSDGPSSIDARGRVVSRIWRLRADSQASLVEQGDRLVDEAGMTHHYVNMRTGPNPLHWHWDVFTLNHPDLGAVGRYQSIEWALSLDEGWMDHRVRSI